MPEVLLGNPGAEPTPAERAALRQRENPLLRSVHGVLCVANSHGFTG